MNAIEVAFLLRQSFEELVSLAETGCLHNVSTIGSKMNLDNDDVYGALSHGTLVFDLGRAVGKDARKYRIVSKPSESM